MASRPAFYINEKKVVSKNYDFEWSGGFAISQKQKNIIKLHAAIGGKTLEVSTKSLDNLGKKFSAFNLKLNGYTLENIFQSSKIFENGKNYSSLLYVSPKEAKRDERLKNSGKIIGFVFEEYTWNTEPKRAFYDYIYCKAVKQCINQSDLQLLLNYDYFTDIEFNPNKSINTQAHAIVIVKMLLEMYGEIPELNPSDFLKFYSMVTN